TDPKPGGSPQSQHFLQPSFSNQAKLWPRSETFRIGVRAFACMAILPPPSVSCKVQLPGDAETVGEPAEPRAEAVFADRHEHVPALRQPGEGRVQLGLALALDEQRHRRGEAEAVPDRAVDAEVLPTG